MYSAVPEPSVTAFLHIIMGQGDMHQGLSFDQGRPAFYFMVRDGASGPEIGLPDQISAGF